MRLASLPLLTLVFASAPVLGAAPAQAGGIERSGTPYAILWEEGNFAQLSFGHIAPHATGMVGPLSSGNALDDYTQFSLGVKIAVNDRLDIALVLDEPVGSDTIYPAGAAPSYPLAGATGILDARALSLMARYRFDNGFSLHGGLVAERISGEATVPLFSYAMNARGATDLGYLVGVAWEKPDIALRVALTYQSEIRHRISATETLGATTETGFTIEMPKALTLDFQTGIAPDTLLFGQIRWRDWSAFEINPPVYAGLPAGPLAAYDHDSVTWTLGVGRRLNDNWSASLAFAHERHFGDPVGNLGPYDGLNAVTLGFRYTQDRLRIESGVTYAWLGNATTRLVNAHFTGSHALGLGVSVGYSF